jgi:N-acetylglucosamine kinase-like BadF-type ATPase
MLTRLKKFFIGVDGGGTKTHAVLVNKSGQVLASSHTGSANPVIVGFEPAAEAILQAINQVTANATIPLSQIASAYFGIAGIEQATFYNGIRDTLQPLLPKLCFQLGTDARIALVGAIGFNPGVVVISGTGSIAFGRNRRGEEARAGGWGRIIGDEGSGYHIARAGLAAVARAYDGRGPQTLITDLLIKTTGIATPADLHRLIYYPFVNNLHIANYSKLVVEAAYQTDSVACKILAHAGEELGLAVTAVIKRLGMQTEVFPVAYVGGTFQAGHLLINRMESVIKEMAPAMKLQLPLESPAVGAAKLAMLHTSLRKSA